MRKVSEFLVNKRYIVLAILLIFTVYSATLISKVNIITDMTEFLPDESQMNIVLYIILEVFVDLK